MDKVLEPIKVSIIVAVYNAEKDLPKCLDSLISQTYRNIEIVCVDDCSSDQSLQVLNDYSKHDSRIQVIHHEENTNAGGAYNSGIKGATGEYICIVDNDDWLSKDAIECLIDASDEGRVDIVGPARTSVFGEKVASVSNTFVLGEDRDLIIKKALGNGFAIIGDLIRRDIFVKNDLYYPTRVFYEDIAIGYCILFYAKSIKGIDKPLYYYTHVPTSVTAKPSVRKIEDRIKTTDLMMDNLKQRGFCDSNYKEFIEYKYLTYSAYTMAMICKQEGKESNKLFKSLRKRIKQYMPNKCLKNASIRNRMILMFPTISYGLGRIYAHVYKDKR